MNLVLYTDISNYSKRKCYVGLVILCNSKIIEVKRLAFNPPRNKKVNREYLGIKCSIKYIMYHYRSVQILKVRTDDIYVLNDKYIKRCKNLFHQNKIKGEIKWVKGHYNNVYNKLADSLASHEFPEKVLNRWYRKTRFKKQKCDIIYPNILIKL